MPLHLKTGDGDSPLIKDLTDEMRLHIFLTALKYIISYKNKDPQRDIFLLLLEL